MRNAEHIFIQGPRQDVDRALTPADALYRVRDGRRRSSGAWGKRHGYTPATRDVTEFSEPIAGAPQAIGELAGRDVLVADGRAYMRDRRDLALWQESGRASAYKPRKTHWVRYNDTDGSVYCYDIAAAGGLIVVAYVYFDKTLLSQLEIQAFDLSGVRVFGKKFQDYYLPKLAVVGDDVIMCAVDGTGFTIDAFYFDTSARTLTNPDPISSVAGAGFGYDIDINSFNELVVAAAITSTSIRVDRVTTTGGFTGCGPATDHAASTAAV